ncbi:hypothetical protein CCACVL1_21617 [Corchorus capsularis]|uniref:Uncharacterized protein n=1 Tax=Corchorus capsularis TaxID=210143 RepID=A0A1R3H357_COCAP|nr:hypothetical protein CCACVL1_21617 [Corchorus capsularis]
MAYSKITGLPITRIGAPVVATPPGERPPCSAPLYHHHHPPGWVSSL